ncbi:MAG: hypothetical protein JW990_21240 [Thermoleophilia bacterium]|nr:hypothetical protein [Thermoleophilia bacterium]
MDSKTVQPSVTSASSRARVVRVRMRIGRKQPDGTFREEFRTVTSEYDSEGKLLRQQEVIHDG